MFHLLVLVCFLAVPDTDCTPRNAIRAVVMPGPHLEAACVAMAAGLEQESTLLALVAAIDRFSYLKIRCVAFGEEA